MKKILTIICYLLCIGIIILSLNQIPIIKANTYDLIIYKISYILKNLSYIIPFIFILNSKKRKKYRLKKNISTVLMSIIIFILISISSIGTSLLHSKEYQERYEEYNSTNIIYQNNENEKEEEQTENTLKEENKEEVIQDNKENTQKDPPKENVENEINGDIKIHFIDVGQGDSIFIELPNNTTMLIDASESSKQEIITTYIKNLGHTKIDYLVGTHPHSDHIGGLAYVINNFSIDKIYMPNAVSTSKTYENLLTTIYNKGLKIKNAKAGTQIINNNNLYIDVLAPNSAIYTDLNNYSIVIKITYKNRKFLFMGDAEIDSEEEINRDVSADVIKIGHHGSTTSSSENFLNKVKPTYAIISVGSDNKYNHPNQAIIDRLNKINTKIYRTDINGNIVITSNGNTLDIKTSK